MRSPRPSNPELILDARLAFDVRRKIRPLFAEISDTMIAFRREVVGQIENAAGRIRQIGLGGMRCKAVEQQQVALLGRNLDELEPGATLPARRKRRTQVIAVLIPTPNRDAASRRDGPPFSTAVTTRSRSSME
jgi:hypothetical protein